MRKLKKEIENVLNENGVMSVELEKFLKNLKPLIIKGDTVTYNNEYYTVEHITRDNDYIHTTDGKTIETVKVEKADQS